MSEMFGTNNQSPKNQLTQPNNSQTTKKFIQFGCWNNLNTDPTTGKTKGCLSKVIDKLKQHIRETNAPDFLVISGDNYYPHKTTVGTTKIKTIYPSKLKNGFDILPNIHTYMILGNHDLEPNDPNKGYKIKNNKNENITPTSNCEILNLQFNAIAGKNIEYRLFESKVLTPNTILFMIDTSIYETSVAIDYLTCYKEFLKKSPIDRLNIDNLNIDNLNIDNLNIDNLITFQLEKMQSFMKPEYSNIIIVGHHPIYQARFKKNKKQFLSDIFENFKSTLLELFDINPDANYYYLCSDLHLFQNGLIEIKNSQGQIMKIKQYISGTGGTELDDSLYSRNNQSAIKETEFSSKDIRYKVDNDIAQCGFLECEYGDTLKFTPWTIDSGDNLIQLPVNDNLNFTGQFPTVSGGSKKRKSRKRNKKYKTKKIKNKK
jgi:hypothetical protein